MCASGDGGNFTTRTIEVKHFCTLSGGGNFLPVNPPMSLSRKGPGVERTPGGRSRKGMSHLYHLYTQWRGFRPDGKTCHFLCSLLFMSASSPENPSF